MDNNIIWSESDIHRASERNIVILAENALQYYEMFIKHMGSAGKFQLLDDLLRDQKIPIMKTTKSQLYTAKFLVKPFTALL
ncbi:hypothetical protein RLOatenuis_6560 [Rickettsiales bacterium]|nr:hypothetical protein RLOatenuis_6560 [Rickettsiales bacterium]